MVSPPQHMLCCCYFFSVCLFVCLSVAIDQPSLFNSIHLFFSRTVTPMGNDVEEINTKELAQRISAELKRYSIPQAIFAQRVLCRSQGTLSDLLRNPKPWSKLKSGRETFRRMFKWLQEPEFQRMSALRMAGNGTYSIKPLFIIIIHQFKIIQWIAIKNALGIAEAYSIAVRQSIHSFLR